MAARRQLREDYRATKRVFLKIAQALNALGRWANRFNVTEGPIRIEELGPSLALVWSPWESPFAHPWRVRPSSSTAGKIDVAGGLVYAGGAPNSVTGLTDQTPSSGWKCYLKIQHYYATGTASVYTLATTTGAWPTSEWTAAHWLTYVKLAEIAGTTLFQYLYDDQVAPRPMPPLPDTTNTYYLRAAAGTIQWKLASTCP